MEIIFQTKRFRRHAFGIGVTAFTIAVIAGVALLTAPNFTERAVHALFRPGIQLTPTKNGLAEIKVSTDNSSSEETSVSQASTAGDRLNAQLELESAAP